jgi:hypothetical protein
MIVGDDIKQRVLDDPNSVSKFHEDDIIRVLNEVQPLFEREKAFIEIKGSAVFVGDIHGDFATTKAIIKRFFHYHHLVFLGDYIDREPEKWGSIHTMTYLLTLKCCYPQKIILLKGNHESNDIIPCFPYEFGKEIFQRFGSSTVHDRFVDVFSLMPVMVLTQKVFAAHGGIVKGANLQTLKKIQKNDVDALVSLLWSDPAISPTHRGMGDPFDENDLSKFLETVQTKVFIRGHDYNVLGYSLYNDRCLTIFSSREYKNMGNRGILVACADKEITRVAELLVEDFSSGQWKRYQVGRL